MNSRRTLQRAWNTLWQLIAAGSVLLCCATQQPLPFALEYEQSGGLGGVPEYRLRIDSAGHALLERWSGWQDTSLVRWQLSARERERLAQAVAAVQQLDSIEHNEPYSDAPLHHLLIRTGTQVRRWLFHPPVPEQLRQLVYVLDSLARAHSSQ